MSPLSGAWLPGALRRRLVVALVLALVATLVATAVVRATFAATTSNPGNSFAAATLAAPGTPTSIHPNVSGTGTGNVKLTWTPSVTSWTQSYLVYRAAATSGTPTWTSIGTVAASACSTTCTYTDSTSAYNQQYLYEVLSDYNSWTTASSTDMALSLAPTTGSAATDTTKPLVTERTVLPAASSQPGQIAAGGTGDANLYFVEQGGSRLGRMSTSGTLVELLLNTGWTAWGVTVDTGDSNNIYFTENSTTASKVGRLILASLNSSNCTSRISGGQLSYANLTSSPCSALSEWTVGSGLVSLRGLAGDSSNIYYAEFANNTVGMATKTGGSQQVQSLGTGSGPTDVTIPSFDTADFYFTETTAGKVGQMRTGHFDKLKESTAVAGSAPWGIVGGPDSNLWFTENGTNDVAVMNTSMSVQSRYTIPSTGASPLEITSGPGGVLWFAESGSGRIGSVTVAGFINEYATPTAASAPWGVANGTDGNLWFTESSSSGNRLGTISPSSSTYALAAADVANLSTGDAVRYQTNAWAATGSTSTYTQAVTFAPTAPVIPSGGAAITTVKVVLSYRMPAVTTGQNNTSAGLRVGISANSGSSYTYYAIPNPQQSSPTCPTLSGGASEACTFTSPDMQVVLTVPSTVIGTTSQLQGMLVQVQAAPGSGSSFALAFDLVHVDVN